MVRAVERESLQLNPVRFLKRMILGNGSSKVFDIQRCVSNGNGETSSYFLKFFR